MRRGIGLVETVVGLALAAMVTIFVVKMLKSRDSASTAFLGRRSVEKDAAFALKQITQIGRMATSCNRQAGTSPAFVALECNIDFDPQPKGLLSKVRFIKTSQDKRLRYEKWNAATSAWDLQTAIGGEGGSAVKTFEVCDQTMMSGTPTCAIGTTAIGKRYETVALADPTRAGRFFRVRLEWEDKQFPFTVQTAFFSRQSSAPGDPVYRWGAIE